MLFIVLVIVILIILGFVFKSKSKKEIAEETSNLSERTSSTECKNVCTKDNVLFNFKLSMNYQITDPQKVTRKLDSTSLKATEYLIYSLIKKMSFDELENSKDSFAEEVCKSVNEGLKVRYPGYTVNQIIIEDITKVEN